MTFLGSRDIIAHVTIGYNMRFPIGSQFEPTMCLARF